jgi:hypothetical protein
VPSVLACGGIFDEPADRWRVTARRAAPLRDAG